MSGSLDIVGIFAVRDGVLEPAGRGVRHLVYQSAFNGTDDATIATTIRYYSPANAPTGNDMAIFVTGRLHAPPGEKASIQSFAFRVFPGDPRESEYEARLPPFDEPIVFAVGKVISPLK
jgi:hypothetical protein